MRACLFALALLASNAGAADELRNWFDDPFIRLSAELRPCPMPAGPFVTRQESLQQSHRRAEKGTTAWLAGEAARPNAFAYDREIGAALEAGFRARRPVAGSSLWATVYGRVVYVEGCVAHARDERAVEAWVRTLPHVQQAIALVRVGTRGRVPYRVMSGRCSTASAACRAAPAPCRPAC